MSSFEWPDLSSLASLARDRNVDVRPVLLRVHTDLFIAAPSRDRDTIKAFEALALGFLPTVDEATAAIVALKLAPVADTPRSIIDALMRRGGNVREAVLRGLRCSEQSRADPSRNPILLQSLASGDDLGPGDVAELLAAWDDDTDLVLARNRSVRLRSTELRELAARGRERHELASALLHRPDLGPGEEAMLYLQADKTRRKQIRARLEPLVALRGPARCPATNPDMLDDLLESAMRRDEAAFGRRLADRLGLSPSLDWRFHLEPRRDLLALALVAAGVPDEACIRIFLTLDAAIACSVEAVFELAHIVRDVSRPLAIYLIEAILGFDIEIDRNGRHLPAFEPTWTASLNLSAQPIAAQRGSQQRRAG